MTQSPHLIKKNFKINKVYLSIMLYKMNMKYHENEMKIV
jgi:hypothetical protein